MPNAESWRVVRANAGGSVYWPRSGLAEERVGRTGDARYRIARLLDRGEWPDIQAKRVVPQSVMPCLFPLEETGHFFVRFPEVPIHKIQFSTKNRKDV